MTEERKEYARQWHRNKKAEDPDYYRKQNQKHKKAIQQWYSDHQGYTKQWIAERRKKYPHVKLSQHIGRSLWNSLHGLKQGRHWEDLVGWTLQDFIHWMEPQFKPFMGWQNHGEWHIDHIRPISSFNFTAPDDEAFKKCWSLENLQPLWAKDNLSKSNKYEGVIL